jgi:hypothetical protein
MGENRRICIETLGKSDEKTDMINPNHYEAKINGVEIQVWDVIDAFGLNFLKGNATKYILRSGKKWNEKEDIKKAIRCLEKQLEILDRDY